MSWEDTLPQNLRGTVAGWPADLKDAFAAKVEAFWANPSQTDTFECADTERACRLGNDLEEKDFKEIEAMGCCGSHTEDWEFDLPSGKVTVLYGFNHGH
jgi:hypothetical protein